MSRIQISHDANGQPQDGALHSWGTLVKLDGKEVRSVRSVQVTADVDALLTAKLDVIVDEALEIDVPADVHLRAIHLTECPSCGLQRAKPVRFPRLVAFHHWRSVYDLTHLRSPDRHRQKSAGQRFSSIEIRIPLWLADVWATLSGLLARSPKPQDEASR